MIGSVLSRLVVVALTWLAATEAAPGALGYGVVAVPLVVACTYPLTGRAAGGPPRRVVRRTIAVVSLVGWFAVRAVVGGVDVARRAVALPRPDVAPEWSTYRTALTTRGGRVALALVTNLMPGTLSSRLDGDTLDVHVIAGELDIPTQLSALERRIARIESGT